MTENVNIQQATDHTDYGVAMKIRESALDVVNKAKIEITQTAEVAKSADSGAAGVYGGIISEIVAPGAKLGMAVVEGVITRAEESPRSRGTHTESSPLRSIDQDVGLAERAPGIYNARPQSIYGGNPKTATDLGGNVLEQVQLTKASLRPPTKDTAGLVQADSAGNISGMKTQITDKTLGSAKFAERLVFEKELASKQALESTFSFEKNHGAAMGMAMGGGIAPQVAMKMAPKDIQGLLSEVRDSA
jgi:hypothetical protein